MHIFTSRRLIAAGIVAALALPSTHAFANDIVLGDEIFGVLQHAGLTGFNNWNDSGADGGRSAIVADPGVEYEIPPGNSNFGFAHASADFAADTITLQIGNPSPNGDSFVLVFDMYFTSLDYNGPITDVQLMSSNLPGSPTFSFGPDSFEAHLPTGGFVPGNTIYTATFLVTAVPEPASLGLLCAGAALMRRRSIIR